MFWKWFISWTWSYAPNVLSSVIADSMVPIVKWSQMNVFDIQNMLDNLTVAKVKQMINVVSWCENYKIGNEWYGCL